MADAYVDRDIGIFIDWWVFAAGSRVIAKNKNDGEMRTFSDLTGAIDWVSVRTNTLSPRYPKGYRSKTVRLLENLNFYTLRQLFASAGEEIVIDNTPPPEQTDDYVHPAVECRRQARTHTLRALESDSPDEEAVWMERAADLHALADRYSNLDHEEPVATSRDPWQHVTGRNATEVAGFGYSLTLED